MAAALPPKVLLVEDHIALRRFVQLALQPLGLALGAVDSVAAAEEWIALEGLPQLLLTDLMLPDGSGLDLVRRLRDAGHGPDCLPVIVLSAAVQPEQRDALAGLQVRAVLIKPVPVAELLATVEQALAAAAMRLTATPTTDPVASHFGGDRGLFEAFRASCLQQMPHDVDEGDAALACGDLQVLRRVAHSLKSVLTLLGQPDGAALARQIEDAGAAGDGEAAALLWPALRQQIAAGWSTRG